MILVKMQMISDKEEAMAFGYVKGYGRKSISLKKARGDSFSKELQEAGAPGGVLEAVISALEGKGQAFAWYREKKLAALYLIERDGAYAAAAGSEEESFDGAAKPSKAVAALKVSCAFIAAGAEGLRHDFDGAALTEAKGRSLFSDTEKIIECGGKILYQKNISIGSFTAPIFFTCLSFGLIYGILFDSMAIGLAFGVSFGLLFGLLSQSGKGAWEELEATDENRRKALTAVSSADGEVEK